MHGMINRALQGFLVATHGEEMWAEVRNLADLRFDEFESMLHYEDEVTVTCFNAATQLMHQQPEALLEDLGTFLVTHPVLDPVRRLLRFGGASFAEFVMSLEELEDRSVFRFNEKIFVKGPQMRRRYKCHCLNDRRLVFN